MKIARKWLKFVAMLAASFGMAGGMHAQQGPPKTPPPPPPDSQVIYEAFGPGPGPLLADDTMQFVGFEGDLGGKTVTGAPFSASFSTQTTRVLADGNQIRRSTTGTFARDSQGRTRRDLTLPAIGPWAASGRPAPHVILINDTVAATQYILQPDRKIARQMQRPPRGRRRQGAPPAGAAGASGAPEQKDISTTSLGRQTVNGVQAEGTRYTRTIPAGQFGNEKPIAITTERWYSTELQTTVMIKRSDPRMGDTVFQLTNIQRQEPDASLFQVPSDYTLRQGGPRAGNRRRNWRGQAPPPPPPASAPGQPPAPPPPQD